VALVTEGCSIFSKFSNAPQELEKNNVKPIPVQVNTAETEPQETEAEVFADLEESEPEPLPEIAGLIPATNPDVRVRNSVRGRNDPFSTVTLDPRIEIEPETESSKNNTVSRGRNKAELYDDFDDENLDVSAPEIFLPTLAQDVIISGLYEADGRTRLIVQAPEESSSRYVEVGQYLSNGQVLVKRINKDSFPGPTIILEQGGIEIAKTIGDEQYDEDELTSLAPAPPVNWGSAISFK
ncbi:MAG: hypothetical protein AAF652_15860, partial [Cyanobacteria bacterium P01_C01_bin.72]